MELTHRIKIYAPQDFVADKWLNEYFRKGYIANNTKNSKHITKEQVFGNFGEENSVTSTKVTGKATNEEIREKILLNRMPNELHIQAVSSFTKVTFKIIFKKVNTQTTRLVTYHKYPETKGFLAKIFSANLKSAYEAQITTQLKEFKIFAEEAYQNKF